MRRFIPAFSLFLALGLAPGASAGEFILTPNAGLGFGGDVDDFDDDQRSTSFGFGLGYFSDSLLGFEVEATYTPDFFGDEEDLAPENNLTTLMGHLVFSGRFGEDSRLYASGGAGLMRSNVDGVDDLFDDVDTNDLGANVGAGVIVGIGRRAGLRADIRYFRNLTGDDDDDDDLLGVDFGDFSYWRASGGLSLRF